MEELKLEKLSYETWLIWDDILKHLKFEEYEKVNGKDMEDLVNQIVFENVGNGFSWATRYARTLLSSVNYSDLADCFNEKIEEHDK
tara:strand:+ start:306 stop:563 length:258 start_codon:yes stop_codon:yes gene_type:complete